MNKLEALAALQQNYCPSIGVPISYLAWDVSHKMILGHPNGVEIDVVRGDKSGGVYIRSKLINVEVYDTGGFTFLAATDSRSVEDSS